MFQATTDGYATTLSGYVITALLAVLTAGFAGHAAYTRKRLDRQDSSLGLLQSSQAVLLAALPTTQATLSQHDDRLRTIEQGYAVLAKELERHEQWHERTAK